MKRGITVSTLTITVTIMLILVSVSTVAGISSIRTASYEEYLSKLTRVSNDVRFYEKRNGLLPITNEIVAKDGLTDELNELILNNGDSYNDLYVVDMNKLNTETVDIGYGTTENMDVFLVAKNTNNVYYLKGYEYKNEMYYGSRGPESLPLGYLIKGAEDYGKTIDYTVTVDGKVYDEWQVYYEDELNEYVFLIAKNIVEYKDLSTIMVDTLDDKQLELYGIFKLNQKGYELDFNNDNSKAIAGMIKYYSKYANMVDYGNSVIGAIGSPTIELVAAGWNAKKYQPEINITMDTFGYNIDVYDAESDGLYLPKEDYCWLASPASSHDASVILVATYIGGGDFDNEYGLRPVVCLKASTPASFGTTTDYTLIK